MASPDEMSHPQRGQNRLHKWALWRMSVNQELIHGLEEASPNTERQACNSFMDTQSITQRYIQNPDMQREQTYHIRHTYGMPPSPKYPMGDTLYFLYGLPRATASASVPEVISSQYASMPNIADITLHDDPTQPGSVKNKTDFPRRTSAPAQPVLLDSREPEQLQPNITAQAPPLGRYSPRPMTFLDRVSELNSKRGQPSPVHFRDTPETDNSPDHVNNINKPVVVPPSVFRSEVMRRSNIDLPLNIDGHGSDLSVPNDMMYGAADDDGFEDPRIARFNPGRQKYTWSVISGDGSMSDKRYRYVDESHMMTHL
ncbi:uncharacterized protein LOC124128033 isoform X2 [Haliotis rufescens]|nr:uncharacterized protein LOC124128033 isoform X2 [Haliotis rufescens]XP_046347410.1 uncharacterized protein LOC124128033 isoform X2 [Haliotis rufescens]